MAIDPPALNRASTALARLAVVGGAALVVTGVPLILVYEPEGGTSWLRTLHSLSSMLFLGAGAGMLLVAVGAALIRDRTWVGWPLALAAFAVAGAGAFTGQLIAWDSLTTGAATVIRSARGVVDALADDVRQVVVNGTGQSQSTYLSWTLLHLAVVPAATVGVGWLVWRRWTSWNAEQEGPAPDSASPVSAPPASRGASEPDPGGSGAH